MTFDEFQNSVGAHAAPPAGMPATLRALWFAAKGQWDAAHQVAQELESADGSWIHAHLHREEGDRGNAGYWYARAEKTVHTGSIAAERDALIRHFLDV